LLGVSLLLLCGLSAPGLVQAELRGFTWNRGTIEGGPRFASDDLDFGIGVDGGYTLGMGVYIGGLFDFYFADDANIYGNAIDISVWMLMAEGGFDFGVARDLVIRPSFAIGISTVHWDCDSLPVSNGFVVFNGLIIPTGNVVIRDICDDSDSDMEGALGGTLLYNLGGLTIGGELRLMFGDFDGVWFGFNLGGVL